MSELLHELIFQSANNHPDNEAIRYKTYSLSYAELYQSVTNTAHSLIDFGLVKYARVATFLPKCFENVITLFAASVAGGVFVPINPLLKPKQVLHILNDSDVSFLVTSSDRLAALRINLASCKSLNTIIVIDKPSESQQDGLKQKVVEWTDFLNTTDKTRLHNVDDTDTTALFYTSGSTGAPKGVVLSHKNIVTGAKSVAQYLKNTSSDRILTILPLSFDYGFSQLSTAFSVGARSILMNYMLPMEVIKMVQRESITGLAAVPPLWNMLVQLPWPNSSLVHLRYITNTGGSLPLQTIKGLQKALPTTKIYLMYGLTEAFRSTYLPPVEINKRPDSMGKAIPNAEIWVLRKDGTPCEPGEPGELVHSGPLVSSGYWNDPVRTGQRFSNLPANLETKSSERKAVWSGDIVRMDEEGYLYFIGRNDDLIKTSGYRVSTTEVEVILYSSGLVSEAVALGIPHITLGQAIAAIVVPKRNTILNADILTTHCKREMSSYMIPVIIEIRKSIPRNPNGKIDRTSLAQEILANQKVTNP